MARTPGLTVRLFLGAVAIVLLVLVAAYLTAAAAVRSSGERAARRGLEQSADLVSQFLAGRSRSLAGGARVFVQGPYFRSLVAERRRDDIVDQAIEASEQLGADWVFITDDRGVLVAKSDETTAAGVPMGDVPLVAGALRGLVTSGFGVSRDSLLFQAVAVPIATPGGVAIGTLVATRVVDTLLVRDVKATTSSEVLFFARDVQGRRSVVLSTLEHATDVAQVAAAIPGHGEGAALQPDVVIDRVDYLAQGTTLTTAGGDAIGGFIVLRSRDAELTGMTSLRRALALAAIVGVLLSAFGAAFVARRITRPILLLTLTARNAADGRYVTDAEDDVTWQRGLPEISALRDAFASLLADLRDKEHLTGLKPHVHAGAEPPGNTVSAERRASRQIVGAAALRGRLAPRPGFTMEPGMMLANRYLIDAVIGSGGLGIVYRARDRVLGEPVAIKVLRPEVLANDERAITQLTDEVRLARRVSHRNVVRMHDIGESDGITFLSMEFVDGASLAAIIETRGALQPAAVIPIARQLMRALTVMHAEGVVHGDLKPANILLDPSGVVKLSDFGLARVVRQAGRDASPPDNTRRDTVGHLAGAVVGTPEYMAPEQLIGATPTPASDIYAAGVVLHECLTGSTPFNAETRMTFIAHKLETAPAATRATPAIVTASTALERVIARMMAPIPERRPQSALTLFDEFAAIS